MVVLEILLPDNEIGDGLLTPLVGKLNKFAGSMFSIIIIHYICLESSLV